VEVSVGESFYQRLGLRRVQDLSGQQEEVVLEQLQDDPLHAHLDGLMGLALQDGLFVELHVVARLHLRTGRAGLPYRAGLPRVHKGL